MELIHPCTFVAAVATSDVEFSNIAKIMSKYLGDEIAKKFLDVSKALDFEEANSILDKLVRILSDQPDDRYISTILSLFTDKFKDTQYGNKLNDEMREALLEYKKVGVICKYAKQMAETMGGMTLPT